MPVAVAPASHRQIGAIHSLKAHAALDDDSYRDVLERETGKRSAKDLSSDEAGRVIERLKVLSNPSQPAVDGASNVADRPLARGAVKIDGPFGRKLKALWLSAWNLGVARDRADMALLAFVERQTGISHTRFLREPQDAAKAIEGLKAWIAREGGVAWPRGRGADIGDVKLAVIDAQRKRLKALGVTPNHAGITLDDEMQALGRQIRAALGR